jgi:MYXO-CTERM domain-containing protein
MLPLGMNAAVPAEIRAPDPALRRGAASAAEELGRPNARGGVTYAVATPFWNPVLPQGTWAPGSLPVPLYVALPKSRDLGDDEDAELEVAARAWNRVSCTAFRAYVAGTTTTGPGDDGVSGVYFEDTTWPSTFTPGAIATTVVHVDSQGHIYDADVYVNGADHVFSLDGRAGTADFRSIATHEIGHVLGLGESNDPRATMYAAYPPGVSWRSLEQDDEDGVCTLYPGTGDLLGCEQTPCPSPFLCVARECERPGDQRMLCSPCDPSNLSGCEGAGDKARCVELAVGGSVEGGTPQTPIGFACGRPCGTSDDCGPGFSCLPTTQAGDYQCVAADDCATAANPCQTASDCKDPDDAGWICSGACLGPLAPDAGDAGADADAGVIDVPRGGCACDASGEGTRAAPLALAALAALVAGYRRKGR